MNFRYSSEFKQLLSAQTVL